MGARARRFGTAGRALALLFITASASGGGQLIASSRAHAQVAPPSADSETEAREAFARGRAAYDGGDFESAAQAFARAYELSGKAGLLYNLYLAFRDANRQAQAAEALRSYLQRDPDAPNRPQLESRLRALESGLAEHTPQPPPPPAAAPAPAPTPEVAAPPPAPAVPPPPAVVSGAPYWRGPVIVMAAGAGVALLAAVPGLIATSKASELEDKCTSSPCDDQYASLEDGRRRAALTSDLMLGAGIATAAGGAIWYFFRRAHEREMPVVSAGCLPGGCQAMVRGRF